VLKWLVGLSCALKPHRVECRLNRKHTLLEMKINNLVGNSVLECLLFSVNVILLSIMSMRRNYSCRAWARANPDG
jgi:hypothetical protein